MMHITSPARSGRRARACGLLLLLSLAAGLLIAWPLLAQDRPPRPPKPPPVEKPAKPPDTPAEKPKDTTSEEEARLLAEREKEMGPVSPGKDPAFLVLPRATERSTMAYDLLTPPVVEMKERGLAYIVRTQNSDGGWSDAQYDSNTGVTALCCLTLMAEGSRPRIGRYGKPLDRGLEFILKNVQTSGVIAGKGSNPLGPMYEHAISMLALLYAYGDMPWRPQTQDVISKGIQAMARSQHLDGGWRYAITREGDSDMSVTANVLWCLRTAKKNGFTVDKESVRKGVRYIEQCALPDGTFRYRVWGLVASPSLGGTGVIALCNEGRIDHPLVAPARDRIEYDYRRYTIADLQARRYYVYGCFYASLAMFMNGDTYWVPWYRKATTVLAKMQRKDGEFPDEFGNTVYSTAMATMVLQAPYGYLPLYER